MKGGIRITMKILFMGTPDFAASSLEALAKAKYNIIGAVTQPDKPKGRGYTLTPPPVKVLADQLGIPVYQPSTLRDGAFEQKLRELAPDIIIVAAYGKILPEYIINFPALGCVNVHASLLPLYRGAAPIQRSIIDGKTETGITIMNMDAGLDTGDILSQRSTPICGDDNFESLHDRLAKIGAELLTETLPKLERNEIVPKKQDGEIATYAHKIEKSDCFTDFSSDAESVHNLIRGLSPFPLASSILDKTQIKLVSSSVIKSEGKLGVPGEVISLDNGIISIACASGAVGIRELIPAGKKKMSAADFIRGRKISVGDKFTLNKEI